MELRGRLVVDGGEPPFSGFRVTATYREGVGLTRKSADVASDGAFAVTIADADSRSGPIALQAIGPDGLIAGSVELPADTNGRRIQIEVTLGEPTVVEPSVDPALGAQLKYTGRVIDTAGNAAPAELVVVIWATPLGATKAAPVSVAKTSAGGYFSGPWRSESFASAFAIVSGGEPVPIVLQDERLPFRIILVLPRLPDEKEKPKDCDCPEAPPRAPDAQELAENAEAFAADRGRCVDFTVPNRAVEEVVFQAVVRTTQPSLNPPQPPRPLPFPPVLLNQLAVLAKARPESIQIADLDVLDAPRDRLAFSRTTVLTRPKTGVIAPAIDRAAALTPGIDVSVVFEGGAAPERDAIADVLDARAQNEQPLRIEPSVLSELARDTRELTPLRLLQAEQTSTVRRFRTEVARMSGTGAGRFTLSASQQLDWESIPDRYQATTIAHGHLLSIKQVWRADGYSYGDLLYSLPLAPGQQKLISVLDWTSEDVDERRAARQVRENLVAELTRDRDISDIIRSSLTEHLEARSHADVESVGGVLGGFVGSFVFGAAGGVSSAGSTASQTSGRSVAGIALNRVRDRTQQAASAVRSQRATVVQTGRQGESVRAQTDVVVNYNHCHALTIEYFEVLRHLQVTQELAQVRECLFIPFAISAFTPDKALRWREQLVPRLRVPDLRWAFDAVERERNNWASSNFPPARYADAQLTHLDGEFWMRITLPRPADDADGGFVATNWAVYANEGLIGTNTEEIFKRNFGGLPAGERDAAWETRLAPAIAQRLIEKLGMRLVRPGGSFVIPSLTVDPTLVSRYRNNEPLLVGVRIAAPLPNVSRADVAAVELRFDGVTVLPAGASVMVDSATMSYRTAYASGFLFQNRRVQNDLSLRDTGEDNVMIDTPLTTEEKVNPRQRDRRYSEKLLAHLNDHVEFYHRVIWLAMDPNRRFLLLDGLIAPDAGGRSVASVVENRIIGIVGNSLVMPVALGQKLDTTYEFGEATLEDLRHLYAIDAAPPMRISMPTPGVFAEAVMGRCNSCEVIDDTRFWRWEEEPIPDRPTEIGAVSTASRRQAPPSLAPDAFPEPLVRLQTAPRAPDPTGLAAAVQALGTANIFRDLTGVALNQANAAQAFKSSLKVGQEFAMRASALAQQKFQNKELDRNLEAVKAARDKGLTDKEGSQSLTEDLFSNAIGEKPAGKDRPTKNAAVKRAMDRVTKAKDGSLRVAGPKGSVELTAKNKVGSGALDVSIDPAITPIKQKSSLVCWAAGGAMMRSWELRVPQTVETVLDALGGDWRARFDRDEGLRPADFRAFMAALDLVEEAQQPDTPQALARLLEAGPLLTIGDDGVVDNKVVHVRIVTRVFGDGTTNGTKVAFADSALGAIKTADFTVFMRNLEAPEPTKTGLGVFHF